MNKNDIVKIAIVKLLLLNIEIYYISSLERNAQDNDEQRTKRRRNGLHFRRQHF